jgi:hypothetical protein
MPPDKAAWCCQHVSGFRYADDMLLIGNIREHAGWMQRSSRMLEPPHPQTSGQSAPADAEAHVLGVTCADDVGARDIQAADVRSLPLLVAPVRAATMAFLALMPAWIAPPDAGAYARRSPSRRPPFDSRLSPDQRNAVAEDVATTG